MRDESECVWVEKEGRKEGRNSIRGYVDRDLQIRKRQSRSDTQSRDKGDYARYLALHGAES